MSLLTLSGIEIAFGAEDILEQISVTVNAGDRIGLVGRNGAGKTTLLHVLDGSLRPDAGERGLARGVRAALVEQTPPASTSTQTVRQEAMSQLTDLVDLEYDLLEASAALAAGGGAAAERYAALHERFEAAGGFTYEARLQQVLSGLGFGPEDLGRQVAQLSGGQRSRLGLARGLLSAPDLLLMDEPTNHLDFAGLAWLEDFLRRWRGALVVTSHDRYFLDRVVDHVWHLEGRRLKAYRGNYSSFQEQRRLEVERQQAEHEAQAAMIAKEEAFIRRYKAGQRAREARGRATRLARVQRIQAPPRARGAGIKLAAGRSGDIVLALTSLGAGYGDTTLVTTPDIEVIRRSRIALIGPNGVGKTTLLRTLAGELQPVEGTVRRGSRVILAHYWQEAEDLDPTGTVLDEMIRSTALSLQEARDLLGMMLFSGEDVFKPVSGLSGGERSRLALAKLTTSNANLLLLDEPTNHLDIPSREALEDALSRFEGTLIFASHDRRLISRLADRLWIIESGTLREFEGTWEEYQARAAIGAAPAARREPEHAPAAAAGLSKQQAARRRQAIESLEAEIARAEGEVATITSQIGEASAAGNANAVGELGHRFEGLRADLDALMARWEALHE